MLRIKLEMEDQQINHRLTMEQVTKVYEDIGDSEIMQLARFVNDFLKAYTYPYYDKDYVFLESVTAEEYERLLDYLDELRHPNEEVEE